MDLLTFTEEFFNYVRNFLLLRFTLFALVLMTFSFVINRIIDWFFRKSSFFAEEVEQTIQSVIRSIFRYGILISLVIYLISQFVDIKGILAGAGIAGVVVGFAAQQLLKDVILGFARLTDKEFRVGDFVTFNGTSSGTIEEISIRFMQIREWSGKLLTIPHGEIRTIQNFNKGRMRVIERITVSYHEDPTRIKELLEKVSVICNEKLDQSLYRIEDEAVEPFQYIGITDLNPNLKYVGYEFCIVGLVKPEEYFETSRQVRFELMSVFHKNQVQMPTANMFVHTEKLQEIPGEQLYQASKEN
ncbi:mechanosensitive ion channel family protein [Bacillus pseudomycoides]|uniref:Mechanosensitive ion channel family protein n=2 Tax=Bacillus pseudomycoides TaxID=64104 RepID=A0AAJ2DQI7_9BACI|nr:MULTISPECIES: mechanosensitive ion channel family protein [Bacillus]MDR4329593.1 mechanosensitive ion channel family protein [Bacillus pseudomycoides]MED1539274.1 mechanosensitive ion channel family protein [Bacillus pseudomycoides]MED1622295.1 mechanosensitive ion channel family protein [Bacillus pseudomycoides]PDZ08873.1 mechanosensitive ion channel family protein [Bacillus pseudomycoides]PDZ71440.1 mechanosensitive ion channel family protein [Bacillus pseudomycoides]